MSEQVALRLAGIGKMYKVFPTRLDNLLDALGLDRLMPWREVKLREFWALRGIDFEIGLGRQVGVIGRNGAGKSTLLKLITGNLAPTEGEIEVNGQVQALLEAGAGFHPEFTGYENIRASLTYQGLTPEAIAAAIEDIAEFTELGEFLAQPFKTYSTGMQTRLVFATATVLKPDVLIIDEILGAGDAYFAGKSAERMKQLVEESGASALIVSHDLQQIVRYCDECLWIERGRIVKRGETLEVIKAYQEFIHVLEDRRLKAKNRKVFSGGVSPAQADGYADYLTLTFQLQGSAGARCDISEVRLLKNGQTEDVLSVGDAQDASWSHTAVLALEESEWSQPQMTNGSPYRSLALKPGGPGTVLGQAVFYSYALLGDAEYAVQVRYRSQPAGRLSLTVCRNATPLHSPEELPASNPDWTEWVLPLTALRRNGSGEKERAPSTAGTRAITRWRSEGSLTIEQVTLLGADGREQAVFPVETSLTLSMRFMAHKDGSFQVLPSVALYRIDGVLVTKYPGRSMQVPLKAGEQHQFRLEIGSLNLGDGHYVFSVAIFRSAIDESERYDLIDRSYEFQVVGNDPLMAPVVFHHAGAWKY